jgi:quercetin dioxygenase-like cupin family protein
MRLLVTGEQTGGRFALLETTVKGTHELPLHAHTREDELVYVVRGDVTFYRDGVWLEGPPGACVLLPRGSEHTCRVASSEARLLVMLMPAGLERYYQEMDDIIENSHYTERLITVSAKYGVRMTGPAPTIARGREDGSPATCRNDAPGTGEDDPRDRHTRSGYTRLAAIGVQGETP